MVKVLWHVVVGVLCAASTIMASDIPGSAGRVLGTLDVAESASGPPAASPTSTADRLRELTAAERLNARLSLEGASSLGEMERQQALQVEALWAEGRHDEAIVVLSQLEAGGAVLAAGIAWRQPVVSQPKSLGADARIGSPRQGAQDVALDFDQETGNLFAVVRWPEGSTLNMSTDDGLTWAERYFWSPPSLVDAAVVDQYLYVAFAYTSGAEARMRRFFVADGELDTSYGTQSVANVSPNTIIDISAGANADSSDDRVYCAFIESDHAVRFFWDVASDGTTWTERSPSPAMVSAASGLDYHWGGGTLGGDPNGLWLSCLGTDGGVHVLAATYGGSWNHYSFSPTLYPSETRARISAYGDYVVVAYTAAGTNAAAPGYHVSYNNGTSWFYGFAYDPPAGAPGCFGVDVTARGGWGIGIIFNSESTFDTVSVVAREDYPQGSPWNPPFDFNQFDAYSGGPSFIQYLGPLEAFGAVYLAGDGGATAIPYFDLIGALPFGDGFESGDTSAWSNTVP